MEINSALFKSEYPFKNNNSIFTGLAPLGVVDLDFKSYATS